MQFLVGNLESTIAVLKKFFQKMILRLNIQVI